MIRGSCLCGGIRFEIEGSVTPIQICYAKRCQKTTGSAFAPELAVRSEQFQWLQGEELITFYDAPILREPPALRRCFCRVCGSHVPVVREGARFVVLMAGILDDDPGARPFREIFTSQAPPWLPGGEDLQRYEGRPPAAERLKL